MNTEHPHEQHVFEHSDESLKKDLEHLPSTMRTISGYLLIAIGILALPLPGPGWFIIIFGLSRLPYPWAQRLIRKIRSKIPGIPEDGPLPKKSIILTVLFLIAATVFTVMWGDDVKHWLGSLWDWAYTRVR